MIEGLSTHYGVLGYTMQARAGAVVVRFTGRPRTPPGGFVLVSPLDEPLREASVDGVVVAADGNEVRLARFPREVILRY
jgi:hypothetical protein